MARVPGAESVGQVGRTRARSRFPAQQIASQLQGLNQGAGNALQTAGKVVSDVASEFRERAFDENAVRAQTEALTSFPLSLEDDFEDLKSRAKPGAAGFAAGAEKQYDSRVNAFISNLRESGDIRSEDLRRIEQHVKVTAAGKVGKARQFEQGERERHTFDQIGQKIEQHGAAVLRSPTADTVESSKTALMAVVDINKDMLSPAQRVALEKQIGRTISENLLLGMINEDPAGTLQDLRDGEFDHLVSQGLSVDDITRFEKFAETEDRRVRAEIRREADRAEVRAGRLVNDAVFVLNRGRVPPNLNDVQTAAKGTRFEGELAAAMQNREAVSEFVQQPFAVQAQAVREIDTRGAATRSEVERQEAIIRAHAALATKISSGNGLEAALEAGAIDQIAPIDLNDPTTFRERAVQVDVASEWAGTPVDLFTPDETDTVALAIEKAPANQVVGLLNGLYDGIGEDSAGRVAQQVAEKRPELGLAISLVKDAPFLSGQIVQGGRLLRENPDVRPGKADRISAVNSTYGNLFSASPGALDSYVDAASSLYAARQVPTGNLGYNSAAFTQALKDVAGTPFEFNDQKILPPVPGMPEDTFEDLVENLTAADLVEHGNGQPVFADGTPFTVEMFDAGFFDTDAQFVTSGPGRYLIRIPGLGFALSDRGGAYEFDFRSMVR